MFYAFEGIDGSGKSTQARLFRAWLEGAGGGREVLDVREPGGTPLGETVRGVLLDPETGELAPETEVFLFMAARSHLVRTRIRPSLAAGRDVVADRFLWSSVVYQGVVGGVGVDEVLRLGRLATGGLDPDLTIVIDVDPALARERLGPRADRMEAAHGGPGRLEGLRQGYLDLARRFAGRAAVVDGSGTPEEVHRRVVEAALRSAGGEASP